MSYATEINTASGDPRAHRDNFAALVTLLGTTPPLAHASTHAPTGTDPLNVPLIAYKSSDQTAIGTSFADVSGTGLAVEASKSYRFEFWLLMDSDATTTGIDVSVNGPASPTAIHYEVTAWSSASAQRVAGESAYDTVTTPNVNSNGATTRLFRILGVLVNGTNAGTLIARAKREAVGSGANARAGSFGIAWKLN